MGTPQMSEMIAAVARMSNEIAAKDATIAALQREVEDWKAASHKNGEAMAGYQSRAIVAEARATTAERQREEHQEAVRVLGVEVRKSRGMKGPDKYWSAREHMEAIDAVDTNPIASAAVRGQQQPSVSGNAKPCYPFSTSTCNNPKCTCRDELRDAKTAQQPSGTEKGKDHQ